MINQFFEQFYIYIFIIYYIYIIYIYKVKYNFSLIIIKKPSKMNGRI